MTLVAPVSGRPCLQLANNPRRLTVGLKEKSFFQIESHAETCPFMLIQECLRATQGNTHSLFHPPTKSSILQPVRLVEPYFLTLLTNLWFAAGSL